MSDAKDRIIKTLEQDLQVEVTSEPSRRFLSRHVNKKIPLVILIADIAGSTELSLKIPTHKLANMIQLFAQEMGIIVNKYNGYVLKYVGDSIIAFFPAEFDASKACYNAITCAKDMQSTISNIINPILIARGYPELKVKIAVNYGSDLVVAYGKSKHAHIDIIGSTISIASKISMQAEPNDIIISKEVYEQLPNYVKDEFKAIDGLYSISKIKVGKYEVDGKAILYRAIDEIEDIDLLANKEPSYAIDKILSLVMKDSYRDAYKDIVTALLHFILAKAMIPSQRKVEVDDHTIDIVIPSIKQLRDDPSKAIIIQIVDSLSIDLTSIQPIKDNIWLVLVNNSLLEYYKDYKVYTLTPQSNYKPLKDIIHDIRSFLSKNNINNFKIFL